MLADRVPRGHRHHQLVRAVELLEPAAGRLLDLGAGTGWLSEAWEGPAVALDVFTPRRPPIPWVVGTTAQLPFSSGAFDAVALFASLGAFRSRSGLVGALTEVARVLRPGGAVVALASARSPVFDALAPHRVRTAWRWHSFEPAELCDAFRTAGLDVRSAERRGGARSLASDWAVTVAGPMLRRTGHQDLLTKMGEADQVEFAASRPRGRYLYIVGERVRP